MTTPREWLRELDDSFLTKEDIANIQKDALEHAVAILHTYRNSMASDSIEARFLLLALDEITSDIKRITIK